MKKYRHLFFDLDHTLWDFETNARQTLEQLYASLSLADRGITSFEDFYKQYIIHNDKLWDRYRNGFIKVDELRWKRMWHTLIDFKIGDDKLARQMSDEFLSLLPTRKALFPYTLELLRYLTNKGYHLHLITNGFEETQHSKLKYAGIDGFFGKVITSEGSSSLKPHREIFDYALNATGAIAESSIMIGDNIEVDIIGAKNAGLDQVYVNHINEVPNIEPTFTVYSLKELEGIF
ncbi:YjjG family noncanonical pyrimidine nucleotidase [Flavihumibacter fluvii]|uniref:YjjG family noncanonical pyrimidine nucleotidase n=1 Tax=Flavihumibacter fluvii TaxID=2838157 RepID=UPI001BDEDDD1|nr:YjjG family noncanonical pyrimidine nucleotidase [Flavihumibacter fluvii]ULQ52297.1 YjjG family noncanonical pyrimidine nucleotidase [Flavihumibacter fluvii]